MAIIQCPECGVDVSSTAKRWPHCGYKIKKRKKRKGLRVFLVILIIAGIIAGTYLYALPQLLLHGQYRIADTVYSVLTPIDAVKDIRKELFYESRILSCAAQVQETLLVPDSLVLSEVVVFREDASSILLHYLAQSRGGSMGDGFVRFTLKENGYEMGVSVDSLTADDKEPWSFEYMSTAEKLEYYAQQEEIWYINLELRTAYDCIWSFDLKRMNAVIQNGCADSVQPLPNRQAEPEPTSAAQ